MENKQYPRIGETLYGATLPNGLRLRVLCKPEYNRSFAMFATNYGGADRRFRLDGAWIDTPAGVAHFLEHKMFDMPDGDDALTALSANGAEPNAFTSSDITAYYFECTQDFEENLRTLLRFVTTPYFTPESVEKEQGIIGQEIRMGEDDPDYAVYVNLMQCLYAHNPVRESVAGTVESIAEITDETLYACHKAFYNPSNMALCVVCPISPDRVEEIAREMLPDAPGSVPEIDYGAAEDLLPCAAQHRVAMEVSAPQFLLGAKVQRAPQGLPLLRQKLVGELALRALTGRASAFYNDLYRDGLLAEDFGADLDYSAGVATLLAGGESRDPERVLARLNEAVAQVRKQGFDPAAFERTRRAAYGGWLRSLDRFEGLCVDLVDSVFGDYPLFELFGLLGEITPAECAAFVTEALAPDRIALSVIDPAKN